MTKRIIIVTLETNIEEMLHDFLIRIDGELDFVDSGEKAFKLAYEQKPDLIIIDRNISDVGAEELCLKVKNDTKIKDTPVIIMLEDEKAETMERCLLSGCDDFIMKPINKNNFINKIGHLLNVFHRKDLRILFRCWLKGKVLSNFFFGNTEDISVSGMLFSTDIILKIDDFIEITFFIPASTIKISMTCKIVRVIPKKEKDDYYYYGVQFMDIDELSNKYFKDYIEKLRSNS